MARLPADLENIMREAIEMGPKDVDAIDDCVSKIEMYRKLFGCSNTAPVSTFKDFKSVDKMIRDTFDKRESEQKKQPVVEASPAHRTSSKHVGFQQLTPAPQEDDGFSTVTKRQKKAVGF